MSRASTRGFKRSDATFRISASSSHGRRPGAPRTRCSSCSPCSSRCRTTTAPTKPRWQPCTRCFHRDGRVPRSDGSEWDAPVIGPPMHRANPWPRRLYNLRKGARANRKSQPQRPTPKTRGGESRHPESWFRIGQLEPLGTGSWDLMTRTRDRGDRQQQLRRGGPSHQDGRPLLANDMHLTIRVPNTWYRASLEWPEPTDAKQPHRLTGVTLPGVPAVVVGSNTRGMGIHQHLRGLERHRSARDRPQSSQPISDAGRMARIRAA